MTYKDLDQKAKTIASRYNACEHELLQIIIEVDKRKAFLHLGFNSLFSYVVGGLGLSSSVAYNFIAVARKSHQVPELKKQVLAGKISIHKARKITAVLTPENQKHWIAKAQVRTQKQLERDVAMAQPKVAVAEKSTYVAAFAEVTEKVKILQEVARIQLQLGVSEKIMMKLRRAQDLESQKRGGAASLEDTLDALLDLYLEKRDPVEKAKRHKMRGKLEGKLTENSEPEVALLKAKASQSQSSARACLKTGEFKKVTMKTRRGIAANIRHQVQLRDGGRCTNRDKSGQRCHYRRYLEMHHHHPVSRGGQDSLENLTLLCSGHHRSHHLREPL